MIYYEKYGSDRNPVILCLHGANYVHCFSKLTDSLSKNYCLIIPHLPGYGRNDSVTFSAERALAQLVELAAVFGKQVMLLGFSLGAQLCLPLMCRYGEYFNGAVMVSPWLIKNTAEVEKAMKQQVSTEKIAKNKLFIGLNAFAMGLDKAEREENAEFCQNVTMDTILASIDNGITLEDYPEYSLIDKPMLALCGIKEITDVRKSVHALAKENPRCTYDMWDGAAHNIPFRFAPRLSRTVEEFADKIYMKN